jgi:aryl-alcohol dehydrogenase-like predicted oxidoreductase
MQSLRKNPLGKTGLTVSEFCLGVLPMGPLYADLPRETCRGILREALKWGVNFFDTAEMYRTEALLGWALGENRKAVVIASKSAAKTYRDMEASVTKSLQELQTDWIDIYLLHAPRPPGDVFRERRGALQCLLDQKEAGIVKAVGISTHDVEIVRRAAAREEIDVIFPLVNREGLGVVKGSAADMVRAIGEAARQGKGLYGMKALGGGNLIARYAEALRWARDIPGLASLAIGVISVEELLQDLSAFGLATGREGTEAVIRNKRLFIFESICQGCGRCIEACHNEALFLKEGKARVDQEKCLLCGYCSPACPMFAIRVI